VSLHPQLQAPTTRVEQGTGALDSSNQAPEFLTQIQICRRMGICDETWRRWRQRGLTPAPAPLPGRPRWRVEDIAEFERRGRVVVPERRR
jgi:hypothetical protein